jgi:hypothetical protein
MLKRVITAAIVLLFAGILITISANEVSSTSVVKAQNKTVIFLSK